MLVSDNQLDCISSLSPFCFSFLFLKAIRLLPAFAGRCMLCVFPSLICSFLQRNSAIACFCRQMYADNVARDDCVYHHLLASLGRAGREDQVLECLGWMQADNITSAPHLYIVSRNLHEFIPSVVSWKMLRRLPLRREWQVVKVTACTLQVGSCYRPWPLHCKSGVV